MSATQNSAVDFSAPQKPHPHNWTSPKQTTPSARTLNTGRLIYTQTQKMDTGLVKDSNHDQLEMASSVLKGDIAWTQFIINSRKQ